MKKRLCLPILFLISLSVLAQDSFEFFQRRKKVTDKLTDGEIVVLFAKPADRQSRYRYRQDSYFYYFTGYTNPDGVALLSKTGASLFVRSADYEKIKSSTGFESIEPISSYRSSLPSLIKNVKTIYTNVDTRLIDNEPPNYIFLKNLKSDKMDFQFSNISGPAQELRVIHSESELNLMRKAIEITDNAHLELMKSTRPGMYEYQLEALLEYIFRYSGALQLAFRSIVGAGINGCEPHYQHNTKILEDGDLIVIDIGAEYEMYCADITRTIPASGKFTDKQKTFYNIVLKSQLAAIEATKPGVNFMHPYEVAFKVIQEELEKVGFIKQGDTQAARKYMKHTISHHLGLDVHDVGDRKANLEPGMVITIEPGLYIPEYNFGIRIEDDVLVTEKGCEVLSHAPKTVEEIEKIMKEDGIGNVKISDISKYRR